MNFFVLLDYLGHVHSKIETFGINRNEDLKRDLIDNLGLSSSNAESVVKIYRLIQKNSVDFFD